MDEAYRLSLKGCDLNKYESCANASVMLRKGEGTDKDPEKAAALADKANELHKQEKQDQSTLSFGGT